MMGDDEDAVDHGPFSGETNYLPLTIFEKLKKSSFSYDDVVVDEIERNNSYAPSVVISYCFRL